MYDVLSPDGFSIHRENKYKTIEEAENALKEFAERFSDLGYYSSVNYGKIKVENISSYCKIKKI